MTNRARKHAGKTALKTGERLAGKTTHKITGHIKARGGCGFQRVKGASGRVNAPDGLKLDGIKRLDSQGDAREPRPNKTARQIRREGFGIGLAGKLERRADAAYTTDELNKPLTQKRRSSTAHIDGLDTFKRPGPRQEVDAGEDFL